MPCMAGQHSLCPPSHTVKYIDVGTWPVPRERKEERERGGRGKNLFSFCLPQHFSLPCTSLHSPSVRQLSLKFRLALPALSSGRGGEGGRVGWGWGCVGWKSRRWRGGRQRSGQDGSLTSTCLVWTLFSLRELFLLRQHLHTGFGCTFEWRQQGYKLSQSNKLTFTKRSASKSLYLQRRMLVWLAWPSLCETVCPFWNYCASFLTSSFDFFFRFTIWFYTF